MAFSPAIPSDPVTLNSSPIRIGSVDQHGMLKRRNPARRMNVRVYMAQLRSSDCIDTIM
jgi:hypothetical protein